MKNAADYVYEKRPVFAEIIRQYGDLSFLDYLEKSIIFGEPSDPKLKKEFLGYFENFLQTWVSTNQVKPILESFSKTWTACTSDHHGIPWHPFFAGGNFAHTRYMHTQGIPYAIVFAASGTSLGNSSLPRSIGFHNSNGILDHVHFFPASMRNHPIYGTQRSTLQISTIPIINKALQDPLVHKSTNFSMQVTRTTHELWKNVPENLFARLAYLPLEELVVSIFIHANNLHPLWQLITTHAEKYVSAIEGIQSAHEKDLSRGSMIFWHRTKDGTREQLRYTTHTLSTNGGWSIECSADKLKQALQDQEIYPTYALCLLVISGYFGITCMGGFSQVEYLAEIHTAYKKLHIECSLPALKSNSPSVFCEDLVVAKTPSGEGATLIDLILEGNYEDIVTTLEQKSFRELVSPLFPELAKILGFSA